MEWIVPLLKQAERTVWLVVVVGRLRKDAALRDVPPRPKHGGRGRPRKYGKHKLSVVKRARQQRGWQTIDCTVYGKPRVKCYKTFLATYLPVGGVIRVVIVKEDYGWYASSAPARRRAPKKFSKRSPTEPRSNKTFTT